MAKRESRWAVTLMLATGLVLPCVVCSQDLPPPHSVTERNEVPVLEAKPGCWQLKTHTSMIGMVVRSKEEIRKEWADKITPEQRAQMPPGYIDQMAEQIQEGEKKSKEQMEKGSDSASLACPATKAHMQALETLSFGDAVCHRTVQASSQVFVMHTECPGPPQARYETDLELPDPQTLKGSLRAIPDVGKPIQQIAVVTGKWISEAAPHMPTGVTDVNGRKPIGPGPVAGLDPYRIVATSNGKPIVAGFAWAWVNRVSPADRRTFAGGLPGLVQQLYAQFAIAEEAAKMHLDVEEPWRSRLQKLGRDAGHDFGAATNYPGDPNIPPQLIAQWQDARLRIYWDAYLGQASTDAERSALLAKIKEKYKITVVDPDFFHVETRQ